MRIPLSRREWGLAAAGAALTVLAYPPFHLFLPSFVALIPLVWLLEGAAAPGRPPRHAALVGFWAGLLANAALLSWMIVALYHFTPLAALGYLATVTILGGWWAVLGWAVVTIWRRVPAVPRWLVFAAAWVTLEWILGHQGDVAFPWLGLGTSLTGFPILVQWADLAGARGVTFWLAAVNVVLAGALMAPRRRWRELAVVGASVVLAAGYGAWQMATLPVRRAGTVVLIQPNVGFRDKWKPGEQERIVESLIAQTDTAIAAEHPTLVVWPEAAVVGYFLDHPQWALAIGDLSFGRDTPIFAGGLDAQLRPDGRYDIYNAAFLFDTTGEWKDHPPYRKQYLVPVVERVPFIPPAWLSRLPFFGAFGRGREAPLYPSGAGRFGALICYESAFEGLPRRYRREGADFLVNITNDAWFGRTSAPWQHEAHLTMRAIETRMGIARAANSGVSEVMSPLGVASHRTALETRATVAAPLETTDVITWYVRLGDWVGVLSLMLVAGLVAVAWRKQ